MERQDATREKARGGRDTGAAPAGKADKAEGRVAKPARAAKPARPLKPARWPALGGKPADALERTVEKVAVGFKVKEVKTVIEEDGKGGKREKQEINERFVQSDHKTLMALLRARETGSWSGDAQEARPRFSIRTRIPLSGGGVLGGDGSGGLGGEPGGGGFHEAGEDGGGEDGEG